MDVRLNWVQHFLTKESAEPKNSYFTLSLISYFWPNSFLCRAVYHFNLQYIYSYFYFSKLADSFIIAYQVGACCVYTLFVVLNIKSVLDVYLRDDLSIHFCLLLVTIPLLLMNSLRNYKILVPFSLFANVITFLTIGCVFYYIFETPLPSFSERPLFQGLQRFPLAFGTTCFAFTSVAIVSIMGSTHKFQILFYCMLTGICSRK